MIWLLDGALQLQTYMYGSGFITTLKASGAGQPAWIAESVNWAASTMHSQQALLNTCFALIQIAIGLGLLCRRTVKPALVLSFAWALAVWWFGEGFGMIFTTTSNPLAGAPGAAILYLLVGLLAWPGEQPGGLLGVRGARLMWGGLWLVMSWMWLGAAGAGPGSVGQSLRGAPSGIGALTSIQAWLAAGAAGHGALIAISLAAVSAAIGLAVAWNRHARPFLALSITLALAFWAVGQGFGGLFAGGATDPNSGPLLVLLACAMYALVPRAEGSSARRAFPARPTRAPHRSPERSRRRRRRPRGDGLRPPSGVSLRSRARCLGGGRPVSDANDPGLRSAR